MVYNDVCESIPYASKWYDIYWGTLSIPYASTSYDIYYSTLITIVVFNYNLPCYTMIYDSINDGKSW